MTDSPYCTIDELAVLLRVPKSWLYEQTRQRTIPHLRPGKRLLFVKAEVVAWFEETHRRAPLELRLPSPTRARMRVGNRPARTRLAPKGMSGNQRGQRADRAGLARVSGNGRRGAAAVALSLPATNTEIGEPT